MYNESHLQCINFVYLDEQEKKQRCLMTHMIEKLKFQFNDLHNLGWTDDMSYYDITFRLQVYSERIKKSIGNNKNLSHSHFDLHKQSYSNVSGDLK